MAIEITAPVGSYESLMSALDNGADSVYFGVGALNMRSGAAVNFTEDDLPEIVKRCAEHKAKAYLALNVVVFDDEMDSVYSLLRAAKNSNIDAVIATDVCVLEEAKRLGLTVHISTQSNITNIESAKFYSRWADVVVLAREMNLKQIKKLNQKIIEQNICGPSGKLLRTEMFVHGALCMAISGKCYLSLDNANRSANRGACVQICRRPYKVTDLEGGVELEIDNKYIMSPKDLATISFLDRVVDSGVSILKIEGRGRPAEYVGTVLSVYKDALKSIEDDSYCEEKVEAYLKKLKTVYNRGFWGGYYLGKTLGEWSERHGSSATKRKDYIGKITNYFSNLGVAEAKAETGDVFPGEDIVITGPTTGFYDGKIDEVHIDNGPVVKAEKGTHFAFRVSRLVRRGDKLFRLVDDDRDD